MSDYPRTQRRLVRVTDTTTGEYGDLVLTLCYVVEAGATGRVALACEAHEYENDGAIASHLIDLDDQFQATCVDSGYHFARADWPATLAASVSAARLHP